MWKSIRNYFSKTHNQQQPTCEICMEHLSKKTCVQLCNCEHIYCRECVAQFVNSKIKAYEIIKCLDESCNSQINQKGEFYTSLTQYQKQKYQKIKRFYFVSKNPQFKLCPKQTCSGFVNTNKKPCSCNKCSQKYCPKCLYKEHWGRCDKQSLVHLQNNLKYIQCSHCNFIIEKNQGCDHITCKCGYQLCYRCGGIWKGAKHICVRSKGFQRVRSWLVKLGQRLYFISQNRHIRQVSRALGMMLINSFYANLVIALIVTVLETICKMASFFSPFDYIYGFFSSEQVMEQVLPEEEQDGFPYLKVYLCVVFVLWLIVRKWVPNYQMRYFLLVIGLLTILLYIVSNLFLVYYYEYMILFFFIENIFIVMGLMIGIGTCLTIKYSDWRSILQTGAQMIKDFHWRIRFARRNHRVIHVYE